MLDPEPYTERRVLGDAHSIDKDDDESSNHSAAPPLSVRFMTVAAGSTPRYAYPLGMVGTDIVP